MSTQTRPAPRTKDRRPLAVLIDETTEHLADLGYHPATITGHRAFWTRLAWMVGPDGLAAPLSKELAARFLASYGVTPDRIDDRLDSGPGKARTAVRILLEYDAEGRISRHRRPQLRPTLPKRFEKLLEEFAAFASEQRGLSPRTVRYYCWDARRFLLFLVNRKGSARIDPEAVSDFLLSLKVQPTTIGNCAVAVRAFLRFLSAKGRIPADWSTLAPPLRVWQSARLSMPWTDEMLQRLFAAVDRGSAGGKRDYAMLLLAARLGLRIGEIRTLALRDVDWKGRRLTVHRTKGGPISELPAPQDVLRALRDYVDRGRPPTSAATLFVRHAAPYEALSPQSDLHGMLCRYCRRAGIEQPEIYLHGMHSLRHAFATRLFRAETPIPTLAGLLGQRSPESPRAYLRIDIETLRRASLEPEYYCHASHDQGATVPEPPEIGHRRAHRTEASRRIRVPGYGEAAPEAGQVPRRVAAPATSAAAPPGARVDPQAAGGGPRDAVEPDHMRASAGAAARATRGPGIRRAKWNARGAGRSGEPVLRAVRPHARGGGPDLRRRSRGAEQGPQHRPVPSSRDAGALPRAVLLRPAHQRSAEAPRSRR